MSDQKRIKQIEQALALLPNQGLAEDLFQDFSAQAFKGYLKQAQIQRLCAKYQTTVQALALSLLPIAACYANAPISHFSVGAIVLTEQGDYYFGANQEFIGTNIQQTIHAEQSAICHAWMEGGRGIRDIMVNYSPCGHCRQFMNELETAQSLHIHLPQQQARKLREYLPYAFGPEELNVKERLLTPQTRYAYPLPQSEKNPLINTALLALNRSHSPYSKNCQGVAIQTKDGKLYQGSYAENAAFNPSLPALQVALNHLVLQGQSVEQIEAVYMLEKITQLSYHNQAKDLLAHISPVELHYLAL